LIIIVEPAQIPQRAEIQSKLNLGGTFFGMGRALASLTVLLFVAAILRSTFLMPDQSFRISYLSDVNDQIRALHRKIFFRSSIQVQTLSIYSWTITFSEPCLGI
jgi:hypothetical protein